MWLRVQLFLVLLIGFFRPLAVLKGLSGLVLPGFFFAHPSFIGVVGIFLEWFHSDFRL